jgi:hypothetical protein
MKTVTVVQGLDHLSSIELAATRRFIVPYGGLLRGRLAPGETLIVVGASGAYGSAAVQLGVALGAERAYLRLLSVIRAGLLDLHSIRTRTFPPRSPSGRYGCCGVGEEI